MSKIQKDDLERCSECGLFYKYVHLWVHSVEPNYDGYKVNEILVCKWCKQEMEEMGGWNR